MKEDEKVDLAAYELALKYRRVFNTPEGRDVLHDILQDLSLYEVLDVQELVFRHNFARILLMKIGAQQEQDFSVITDAYLKLPIERPEQEKT